MKSTLFFLKGSVLAGVLFLVGCSEDFASLHFDSMVERRFHAPGHDEKIDYREFLLDELATLGVSVDQLDITSDGKDPQVLHIRVRRSLDPQQRERIRRYLEQRLLDRKAATYAATLETYPERVKPPEGKYTLELSRVAKKVSLEPQGKPTINILRLGSYVELVLNTESAMMQCEVVYALKHSLPFYTLGLTPIKTESEQALDHNAEVTGNYVRGVYPGAVPANLKFHDPHLAKLVDEGMIDIRMRSKPFKGIEDLSFMIDGLGRGSHHNGSLSSGAYYSRQRQCDELAGALGRPFSFHMGEGMDRLSRVTFKQAG